MLMRTRTGRMKELSSLLAMKMFRMQLTSWMTVSLMGEGSRLWMIQARRESPAGAAPGHADQDQDLVQDPEGEGPGLAQTEDQGLDPGEMKVPRRKDPGANLAPETSQDPDLPRMRRKEADPPVDQETET